jgi:hypothetical protein
MEESITSMQFTQYGSEDTDGRGVEWKRKTLEMEK